MIQLKPFIKSGLFFNTHLQTIFGDALGHPPDLKNRLEILKIPLPDGDILINEYLKGTSSVVCLLGHGLTGDSSSSYLLRTAEALNHQGHHIVIMNHRNCGLGFGQAKQPYHSGKGDDIGEVISFLRQQFPEKTILFYGYSMSANAGLRLLCETELFFGIHKKSYLPDAAFIANPPINLSKTSDLLSQGLNQIYEKFFLKGLIKSLHLLINQKVINPERLKLTEFNIWMKIKKFDQLFTSIYSGFKDADDYYQTCSTHLKINRIQIPTLIITSDDDSFIDSTDFKHIQLNPNVQLHITQGGGHLGYISKNKNSLGTYRWLDYAAATFTEQILKKINNNFLSHKGLHHDVQKNNLSNSSY